MPRSSYDAVFVDFYGTLVTGDRQAVLRTCRRVIEDHDLPFSAEDLAERWGRQFFLTIESSNHHDFRTLYECECVSLCDVLEPWCGVIDPVPYASMLKSYWCDPPPVPEAIAWLRRFELPVCIVSNADRDDVLAAMRRLNISIESVVTSEDARSYKPDSVIFQNAMAQMNVSPERVLHIGDSLHSDVGGARLLGIASCWVCYKDRILDVGKCRADYKISCFKELSAILG